jgi:hypothetical protein
MLPEGASPLCSGPPSPTLGGLRLRRLTFNVLSPCVSGKAGGSGLVSAFALGHGGWLLSGLWLRARRVGRADADHDPVRAHPNQGPPFVDGSKVGHVASVQVVGAPLTRDEGAHGNPGSVWVRFQGPLPRRHVKEINFSWGSPREENRRHNRGSLELVDPVARAGVDHPGPLRPFGHQFEHAPVSLAALALCR